MSTGNMYASKKANWHLVIVIFLVKHWRLFVKVNKASKMADKDGRHPSSRSCPTLLLLIRHHLLPPAPPILLCSSLPVNCSSPRCWASKGIPCLPFQLAQPLLQRANHRPGCCPINQSGTEFTLSPCIQPTRLRVPQCPVPVPEGPD